MNQTYLRRVGFCIALLTFLQLLGCSTSGTKTTPPLAPQITQFGATPTTVTAGQTATISWSTTNATSITIAPTVGTAPLPTSGSAPVTLTATTTYTLTATSSDGTTATKTLTVSVTALIVPQITQFSATPTTVTAGQTATISWSTTNATSITIAPTVGTGPLPVSGSASVPMTATTTFTLTATSTDGTTATQTLTVTVTAAPIVPQITQFRASPTDVNSGQTSTITWATTNAASVAISPAVPQPDDTGPLPTSGSSIAPIIATTAYTLTATSSDGHTATQALTVTVPFTLSLSVSPATITAGQSATLSWQITGGTATALAIDNSVCGPCTQSTYPVTPNVTTTYTATATASDGSSITTTATLTVSPAPPGVIKHIFFMLQENRSFDMYFGQLAAYRTPRLAGAGITDNSTIDAFDPSVTLTNANTGATVTPFHETTVCTENLTPAWDESHHDVALTGGDPAWATTTTFTDASFSMNNFLDTTGNVTEKFDPNGTRAMGYYDGTDLPYYYDLASFFATSDTWHSPILANTVPNRMYLMAATSFGHEYPDNTGHPQYAAPTIFRAMNTANVSWLYYYKDGIFLANFADFQDPAIGPKTFPVSDLLSRLQGSCSGTTCDPDQALPQVIFIDSASSGSALDEHPDNNIQKGAAYVQSIIAALMQSDAWHDSVFILTYDEAGGLYDHVPPFMVPEPDSYQPGNCPDPNNGSAKYCAVGNLGGSFDLTGLRVPLIVISPYAKPNFVSHVPRDHTAILAYIEKTFNVAHLTDRDNYWLLNPSLDMSEFFDLNNPPALQNAPGGASWTTFLTSQPSTGTCDKTKEASSTP
jgi:phospholipase C